MKKGGRIAFSLATLLPFTLLGTFLSSGAHQYQTVRVKKGDTVSYLSFKVYGMYSPRLGELIQEENPQVKDINRIYIGQELRFPPLESIREKLGAKPARLPEPDARQAKAWISSREDPLPQTPIHVNKGVITYLEGEVKVKRTGDADWIPAQPNMILCEMDQLKVERESRAELILDNQTVMRLSPNSHIVIEKLQEDPRAQREDIQVGLRLGTLWTKVAKLFYRSSRYDVSTPTAIAGVQGTTFQISVASDQTTQVQVFQGVVNVYNPFPQDRLPAPAPGTLWGGPEEVRGPAEVPGPTPVTQAEWTQIVLRQFQQITVARGKIPRATSLEMARERQKEWVLWNEERDEDFRPLQPPRRL